VFEEEDVLQITHQDGHILNFTALEAYALFTLLYDHREVLLRHLSQEMGDQAQETEQS